METINEILNFHFSHAELIQAAKNSFPSHFTRLNDVRINKLNKITEEVGETSFKFIGETLIPQVFRKFKNIVNKGELLFENFERRELRTLSYSLTYSENRKSQIFSQPNELDFVFEILEVNWRDSYLIGLIDCYLKSWASIHTTSSEKIGKFIVEKLRQYKGGRTVLKSFKTNIKFFDSRNGDVVLGSELAIKNKRINDAPKYLSLPESWFTYPYFSKVILAYYEKRKNDIKQFIDDLNIALLLHNNSLSNKRLISKLIIQANTTEFSSFQDQIKSMAFKFVGDPAIVIKWATFDGLREQENSEIKQARTILNEWITREFITVFFDLIRDSRRKKYWKKFSKQITGFTIVGTSAVRNALLRDSRISEYVNARFKVTESSRTASAFIMRMKDYVLIEFSVPNFAFYALKENHILLKNYETRKIKDISEFVDGTMPTLTKRRFEYMEEERLEGRLFHRDGNFENGSTLNWESIFDWWIKKHVGVDV